MWIALPILLSACQKSRVPDEMVAAWVTENQRYKGCYLLISPEHVTVGASDASMHDYAIRKVKTTKENRQLEVKIIAVDDQLMESTFSFIYQMDRDDGVLHFENQPHVVWQRSPCVSPFY